MKMRDHSRPSSPSSPDQADYARPGWINAATSGLILGGLAAFCGLVGSMFYIGSEDLAEDYLHTWFTAFWFTVCGSALLSAGLAGLRWRVPRSHPRENGIHTKRR
jgi:hypothetical protein